MLVRAVARTLGETLSSTVVAFVGPDSSSAVTAVSHGGWKSLRPGCIIKSVSHSTARCGSRNFFAETAVAAPLLLPLSRCQSLAAAGGLPGSWRPFTSSGTIGYEYRYDSDGDGRGDWGAFSGGRTGSPLPEGLPSAPRRASPHDPYGIQGMHDMPSLAGLVNQSVAVWSQRRDIAVLRAAFNCLAKVGTQPTAHRALVRSTFRTLQAAYLPLVPSLEDPYSCVGPLWACAKLKIWDADGLAEAMLRRLAEPGTAVARQGKGEREAAEQGQGQGQMQMLREASGKLHANLWWAVSQAPRRVAALAAGALRASAACLLPLSAGQLGERLNSQDCANVLLACATLRWYDEPALAHRLTACLAANRDANCQDLAGALAALGDLYEDCGHVPRGEELRQLATAVLERLGRPQGPQPPMAAAPSGAVRWSGSSDDNPAVSHGGERYSFTPHQLSRMLLGCSKLPGAPPSLLQALAAAVEQAAGRTSAQGLATSMHALATLEDVRQSGPPYTQAAERLCSELHQRLQQQQGLYGAGARELSWIACALEKLRPLGADGVARALAAECANRRFAAFQPQSLSRMVWAMAKVGLSEQAWYEAVVAAAARQPGAIMRGARLQDWSNLLFGMALVRHRPAEDLLKELRQDANRRRQHRGDRDVEQGESARQAFLAGASPQHCANLLRALADLGLHEQGLVSAVAGRLLLQRPARMPSQALADILWSLVVMGPEVLQRHHGLAEGLLHEAVRRWERGAAGATKKGGGGGGEPVFTPTELQHLWQVQLELAAFTDRLGGRGAGCVLSPQGSSLLAAAREATERGVQVGPEPSELARRVLQALTRLQRQLAQPQSRPQTSHSRPSGGPSGAFIKEVRPMHLVSALLCRVDAEVVLSGGRRVAVEVDEPGRFLANAPHMRRKDGRTELRDRQLRRVYGADNVVRLPYWEWSEIGTEGQQVQYLCRMLGLPALNL